MFSPIDLETKEFKKVAFGGYDREDIDRFTAMLFQDYKTIYMENIALKDKVGALSSAVTKYKSMEDVLQNTLVVAQTTSDELKIAARDRAKAIIDEAEAQAQTVQLTAQEKVSDASLQLKNLKLQMSAYKKQMMTMLKNVYDTVENIPDDTERND